MVYKIEIRPFAATEIVEAFDWYEVQKQGLGHEFLDELEAFYNSLQKSPFAYSYFDKPVRQGRLRRFPYLVVYEVFENNIIVIYSVFMAKRNPDDK